LLPEQMGKVKYFFKNITLLNTLLVIVIIFMANYSLLSFHHIDNAYTLPAQKKAVGGEEANQAEFSPPSPSDYIIISEENLFHPERRIPPEKKVEQELPKPEFVLYGIMVTDDLGVAYLEDLKAPRTTTGRGKRQVALKKGDIFSGFTLKEIEADKIVMMRGEEKMLVHIIDPQKPKTRTQLTPVVQKAPAQPAQSPQKGTPTSSTSKKAPTAKELLPTPKEPPVRPPPRSAFDSTVREFFDRPNR
jgi:type II secretory pathway component PulC